MCPHHLLPYRGVAHVAYLPAGKLVGFGRLAELVECFTKRLTLQERATHQIADALCRHLGARGAGCVIEAEQLCLALPDERHDQSGVVTSAFVGEMRERPDLKARLLDAARSWEAGRDERWPRRAHRGRHRGVARHRARDRRRAGRARARGSPGCARNPARRRRLRVRRRASRPGGALRRRRAAAASARPTCWSTTPASSRAGAAGRDDRSRSGTRCSTRTSRGRSW